MLSMAVRQIRLIAVTSDSNSYSQQLVETFEDIGLVRRNTEFNNNLHSASRYLSSYSTSQALIDWYILGEAPFAICTPSTYCLSARARLGFANDGRLSYQHCDRSCSCLGDLNSKGWRSHFDTLTDPESGRVW
eukprot:TRINITY_DN15859_c0_g1_i4.p1 TRINITY_DN15859_c0_g1~~TRINITY_DN15859_c0_g1_i4.p1  ORF type:complete len:133 (-),score=1.12 TRINITY_DN15859_c0_g1_i4:104-502(-)